MYSRCTSPANVARQTLILLVALGFALWIPAAGLAQDAPMVWVASPWEHVLRDSPPGQVREANLVAARNEYEPFRVIVRAGQAPLREVTVQPTDLVGSAGRVSAQHLACFREHYIHITAPGSRSTALAGWYPDPLIPFVDPVDGSTPQAAKYPSGTVDIEAGANQGFFVDVYVPPDTPAGDYTGALAVLAGGEQWAEVPVRLTVWPFALPDTIAMRSNFGYFGERVAQAYGLDENSDEFRDIEDRYIDTMLSHRCIPSSLGRVWPSWTPEGGIDDSQTRERLRSMVEDRHVNSLALPFPYGDGPERCRAYLHDLAAHLRGKGWLDLGYIYMLDEPNDADMYRTVREQAALIHEADPGIKRLCTEQTITSDPAWGDLYGSVDIWCPLWGLYDEPTANERLAAGEELWSYTALCQCDEANPFWEIDFPPIVYRAPFWVSWRLGITGFLYWSSVYVEPGQDPWEGAYFRQAYWGEGFLLYPGLPAGLKSPVPSLRLKLIREGMEDYEYMALAAQRTSREAVADVVDDIARSFVDWDRSPERYTEARAALARMIAGE